MINLTGIRKQLVAVPICQPSAIFLRAASHNPVLTELYDYFAHSVAVTVAQTEPDSERPEPSQEDHELLLAAIRRQDEARAEALARALLQPVLD